MRKVHLVWEDAAAHGLLTESLTAEEMGGTTLLEAIGFLVKEDDKTITIAMIHSQSNPGQFRFALSIPKATIVSITRFLDHPKQKKGKRK